MQVSSPRAVVDADKCRFINVALDDVAAAIGGTQHTLRPFGIMVRRRLQLYMFREILRGQSAVISSDHSNSFASMP
jgi:hypothetical protein